MSNFDRWLYIPALIIPAVASATAFAVQYMDVGQAQKVMFPAADRFVATTMLLTAGQYTLAALNDPFFQGDDWLGLPPFYVSFGFLTDPVTMPLIYAAQFAAILGAHLLAVVLALKLVGQGAQPLAHLPLTALMVGYTVLGLWLLSTARTG